MEGEVNYPTVTKHTKEWEAEYETLQDKTLHNIVMNYRWDADVPTVYAFYNDQTKPLPLSQKEVLSLPVSFSSSYLLTPRIFDPPPRLYQPKALYLQSACRPHRDAYVSELMKFFPVDALGACLNNAPKSKDTQGRSKYYMVSSLLICCSFFFWLLLTFCLCCAIECGGLRTV